MAKDKLEDFIRSNKSDFDDQVPSPDLWDKIQKREQTTPVDKQTAKVIPLHRRPWMQIAAAVLIAVGSISIYEVFDAEVIINKHYVAAHRSVNASEESVNREPEVASSNFVEAEHYYQTQVSHQMAKLKMLSVEFPELTEEIAIDLAELDEALQELKLDLAENLDNEEVVQAMVRNYKIKLEILETVLNDLQEQNTEEDAPKNI